MNFLAHAYLSFNDADVLAGNMISDFVKGRKKWDYSNGIRHGIELHRLIDAFTDEHPATRTAKDVFRPAYRLYSGAFIDVAYDHFLAIDANEFTESSLFSFSQQVYSSLERHKEAWPVPFAALFPYMKERNWLFNYRTIAGITRSFEGVVRRATYLTESNTAAQLFETHYQLLGDCYRHFWADVKVFAREEYDRLKETES